MLLGDFRGERLPRRITVNPVPDMGRLLVQQRDDVSLQVPAALVAREQEALRTGRFTAVPEDGPKGLANLPKLGSLAVSKEISSSKARGRRNRSRGRILARPRSSDRWSARADRPRARGPVLDELQQATSHSLPTIRLCDEEVREFRIRGRVEGRDEAQTREAKDLVVSLRDHQRLDPAGVIDSSLHRFGRHAFSEPPPVERLEQRDQFWRIRLPDLTAFGGLSRTVNPSRRASAGRDIGLRSSLGTRPLGWGATTTRSPGTSRRSAAGRSRTGSSAST